MTTHDKKPDGVDTPLADQHDLESYRQAEEALSLPFAGIYCRLPR